MHLHEVGSQLVAVDGHWPVTPLMSPAGPKHDPHAPLLPSGHEPGLHAVEKSVQPPGAQVAMKFVKPAPILASVSAIGLNEYRGAASAVNNEELRGTSWYESGA